MIRPWCKGNSFIFWELLFFNFLWKDVLKHHVQLSGERTNLFPISSSVRWACILVFLSQKKKNNFTNYSLWKTAISEGSHVAVYYKTQWFVKRNYFRRFKILTKTCSNSACSHWLASLLYSRSNVRKTRLVRAIILYLQETRNVNKQRRAKVLLWLTALIFLEQTLNTLV